jgi:hypothetical protein
VVQWLIVDVTSPERRRDLRAVVASFVGRRLRRVRYCGLRYDGDQTVDWDYDNWHHPEMGVEFELDDGSRCSAVWGDAFGKFNIDFAAEPIGAWFPHVADVTEHFRVWEATDHPRWTSLIAGPVLAAALVWADGWGEELPVSVHLTFPNGDAWIAAARPQDFPPGGAFDSATDEVIVVFDQHLATKIGVAESNPRRDRWFAYRGSCPQCGRRLEAVYAVVEQEPFLECPDCGLGFHDPSAVENPSGQVYRHRQLLGQRRPATRQEMEIAGWSMADLG